MRRGEEEDPKAYAREMISAARKEVKSALPLVRAHDSSPENETLESQAFDQVRAADEALERAVTAVSDYKRTHNRKK